MQTQSCSRRACRAHHWLGRKKYRIESWAGYKWDPKKILERVAIHPEADHSFMDTVVAAVAHYAPSLKDRVRWSAMKEAPPLPSYNCNVVRHRGNRRSETGQARSNA